jgi:hypothetical protein
MLAFSKAVSSLYIPTDSLLILRLNIDYFLPLHPPSVLCMGTFWKFLFTLYSRKQGLGAHINWAQVGTMPLKYSPAHGESREKLLFQIASIFNLKLKSSIRNVALKFET